MPDARRDDNRVTTLLGVSTADGVTPVPVQVNPVTGKVIMHAVDEGIVAVVGNIITRDRNYVDVGRGERTDNTDPIPFHASPSGKILIG